MQHLKESTKHPGGRSHFYLVDIDDDRTCIVSAKRSYNAVQQEDGTWKEDGLSLYAQTYIHSREFDDRRLAHGRWHQTKGLIVGKRPKQTLNLRLILLPFSAETLSNLGDCRFRIPGEDKVGPAGRVFVRISGENPQLAGTLDAAVAGGGYEERVQTTGYEPNPRPGERRPKIVSFDIGYRQWEVSESLAAFAACTINSAFQMLHDRRV